MDNPQAFLGSVGRRLDFSNGSASRLAGLGRLARLAVACESCVWTEDGTMTMTMTMTVTRTRAIDVPVPDDEKEQSDGPCEGKHIFSQAVGARQCLTDVPPIHCQSVTFVIYRKFELSAEKSVYTTNTCMYNMKASSCCG